jgi:chromosome segregation ATPase
MNELNELEKGISDMKKSSADQKRLIDSLKTEKSGLIENSRLLNQRLSESQAAFEKTSRKIIDFIKDHINEIKLELGALEVKTDRIPGIENELSKQESFLNKLSSSDAANIERLSTELLSLQKESESQKEILDTLKIKLSESLERSISSLKKDLESNRKEDVENSLREFKSEIKRISTLEQTLESSRRYIEKRLDVLQKEISGIDSAPSQIREINKKLSEMNKQFTETLSAQRESLSYSQKEHAERMLQLKDGINTQLTKSVSDVEDKLDSAMKYVEKRTDSLQKDLSDVKPSPLQIRELSKKLSETRKQMDLQRQEFRSRDSDEERYTAELNKSIEFMKASLSKEEEKSESLFKRVTTLENTPPIVSSLKQSISELRTLYKDLGESKVSQQDFTKTTQSLSKSLSEIQNIQATLEKSLSNTQTSLQSQINDLFSDEKITKTIQKHVQQNLDQSIQETNQELKTEFENLSTLTSNIQEQLTKSVSGLTDELTEVDKKLSQNDTTDKTLQQDITNLSKSIEEIQAQNTSRRNPGTEHLTSKIPIQYPIRPPVPDKRPVLRREDNQDNTETGPAKP